MKMKIMKIENEFVLFVDTEKLFEAGIGHPWTPISKWGYPPGMEPDEDINVEMARAIFKSFLGAAIGKAVTEDC
jgi:hypothetical protein